MRGKWLPDNANWLNNLSEELEFAGQSLMQSDKPVCVSPRTGNFRAPLSTPVRLSCALFPRFKRCSKKQNYQR